MTDELMMELRQLLEDVVVADVKLLSSKLDAFQAILEAYENTVLAGFETIKNEMGKLRAEIAILRAEVKANAQAELLVLSTPKPIVH